MPGTITYYAIVGEGRTTENPWGLLRRLEHKDGSADEGLGTDFRWGWTGLIAEWERGDFEDELVEVSHAQASNIIEHFRLHWPW